MFTMSVNSKRGGRLFGKCPKTYLRGRYDIINLTSSNRFENDGRQYLFEDVVSKYFCLWLTEDWKWRSCVADKTRLLSFIGFFPFSFFLTTPGWECYLWRMREMKMVTASLSFNQPESVPKTLPRPGSESIWTSFSSSHLVLKEWSEMRKGSKHCHNKGYSNSVSKDFATRPGLAPSLFPLPSTWF